MSDAPRDSLTVLTTKGPLATKRIIAGPYGPEIIDCDSAARFRFAVWPVTGFDSMAAALERLQPLKRSLVVRGEPAEGVDWKDAPRRLLPRGGQPATLVAKARHWLPLDFDSIERPPTIPDPVLEPNRVVEHIVDQILPPEFEGVSTFWCFTSGQGFKPGIRVRLWFWLSRSVSDDELKWWFAKQIAAGQIDKAIFHPIQEIYTAAPLFEGVSDPVPARHGIWRGYSDAVDVPVIEKPQRKSRTSTSSGNAGGQGGGYEAQRARIGDDPGQGGFHDPVKSAVAAFIGKAGITANTDWLRADLEQAIRDAPRDPAPHPDSYIEFRVRDLDTLVANILAMEEAKHSATVEPIEPTYSAPLGSVEEARRVLAEAMDRFADVALSWEMPSADNAEPADGVDLNPPAEVPLPPVDAINAAIGTGKTRTWRERVAPRLIAAGKRTVLAVPRHKLGDEIVRDFAANGVTARVYRSRDADDPDAPGKKMCRDMKRVREVERALGTASSHACKKGQNICSLFYVCGYQKQLRQEQPNVWIVAHNVLFYKAMTALKADVLAIDESFHGAGLRGIDTEYAIDIDDLLINRQVPMNPIATRELMMLSRHIHSVLENQQEGRISRHIMPDVGVGAGDAGYAYSWEWARKEEPDVYPGMDFEQVQRECGRVSLHNQIVAKLGRFWQLLKQTINAPDERSPWLEVRYRTNKNGERETIVKMSWREDIHKDWRVPTLVLDATMQPEIVREFFPQMGDPVSAEAPIPHTRVRQITDRPMSEAMLIGTETASERRNKSRENNVERVRRLIEVRAADVRPGTALVICQEALETALKSGALPENVALAHYNDITGLNTWADAALVMVVGRTEPSPRTVEHQARALFGADVTEAEADEAGNVCWPRVARGIRMRDGTGRRVESNQHPDRRVEAVRWAICEAELIQAIGRGRGVNRTAADPLEIDILTNICLPIEVDETTTWETIQPSRAEVMRSRSAVPGSYRDMAAAYPDLFDSPEAARKALERENPGQMSIERFLIDVCPGFLSAAYRRPGTRGPAARLLYDPARIDPAAWLVERIGDVTILDEAAPVETEPVAEQPATAPDPEQQAEDDAWLAALEVAAAEIKCASKGPLIPLGQISVDELAIAVGFMPERRCRWIVDSAGERIRRCGEAVLDGLEHCSLHRARYAETLLGEPVRPPMPFGPFPTGYVSPVVAA